MIFSNRCLPEGCVVAAIESQWAYGLRQPAVGPRRRLSRRARRNRFFLALALGLILLFVVPWAVGASGSHAPAPVLVTVEAGDTLWDIAGRYTPEGGDRRRLIYEINRLNKLQGLLQPGQTLIIPGQPA